jgi:hypothetical protein
MKRILGLSACLLAVGIAYASVTIDKDGNGFVGKGDVQIVLGWNNAALQKNATSVKFTYSLLQIYKVTEEWATGNPEKPKSLHTHEVAVSTTYSVDSALNGDPRQTKGQNQFTGFILKGWDGPPVVVGEPLPEENDFVQYDFYVWEDQQDGTQHMADKTISEKYTDADGVIHEPYPTGKDEDGSLVYLDLPADAVGNLYTEGGGKAVNVELLYSSGGLYVNGVLLPITPPVTP